MRRDYGARFAAAAVAVTQLRNGAAPMEHDAAGSLISDDHSGKLVKLVAVGARCGYA